MNGEQQSYLDKKRQEKVRNDSNNAQAVKAAADVASKSGHPVAAGIGKGVQIADKLSGGKASEMLGKRLTKANKFAPGGRRLQNATNKLAESGMADKLAKANSARNGNMPSLNSPTRNQANKLPGQSNANTSNNSLIDSRKKEVEEQASDGGGANLRTSFKVVKYGLIACACFMPVIVIMCLLTSASQVVQKSVGISNADSLSSSDAEEKINKKLDKEDKSLNEDTTDEEVGYDYFIDDSFRKSKLDSLNLVQTLRLFKRKNVEVTLDDLEDFYPSVEQLGEEYDKNLVYDFFFKMYNIYKYYDNTAYFPKDPEDKSKKPILDLPLLMATLMLQSDDMNVIFSSNLEMADREKTKREQPVPEYAYDYDWSNYVLTEDNSTHDMEILVQHMVSKQVRESCKDSNGKVVETNILKDSQIGTQVLSCPEGQTYSTSNEFFAFDDDKYREFLKEFIEKKYYVDSEETIDGNEPSDNIGYNPGNDNGSWRNWKQCGGSWKNIKVPKSNNTLCQIGCLITSITIQIARSGTVTTVSNINPGVAVKKFSFEAGGNLKWNSVSSLAPNFKYRNAESLVGLSKDSIAKKLTKYDPKKYYIVLAVSKKNRGSVHHYVALDYVDQNTKKIYMIDPASTNTNDLYSIYKVYNAHIYEKKD